MITMSDEIKAIKARIADRQIQRTATMQTHEIARKYGKLLKNPKSKITPSVPPKLNLDFFEKANKVIRHAGWCFQKV